MSRQIFSDEISRVFLQDAVKVNRIRVRAVCIFCIIIEAFNMFRVLFLSQSGLGTLNNRTYFSLYLSLFLVSLLLLLADLFLRVADKSRFRLYMAGASLLVLWNTIFNIYDIYSSDAKGNMTIVTAMLIFSALFVMRPLYAFINLGINYLLFAVFLWTFASSGEVINFTLTFFLCIIICVVQYHNKCTEITQRQRISEINQELKDTKDSFRLSLEQYERIRKESNHISFEWDIHTDTIRFSDECEELFGFSEFVTALQAKVKQTDFLTSEQKDKVLNCMENVRKGVVYQQCELQLRMKTREKRWFHLRVVTQFDQHKKPLCGIGYLLDITDQKQQIVRLEQELQTDLFTNVLNKVAVEAYGERKMRELLRGERLAMLILDIDDFKNVNDQKGHQTGDMVLKTIAGIMQQRAPDYARVGRIGGDEFAVLLCVKNNLDCFLTYAEHLVSEIPAVLQQEVEMHITCSVGIAVSGETIDSYARLYKAADQSLYKAKQAGKSQVSYFEDRADTQTL